jgi:hypothetical protein
VNTDTHLRSYAEQKLSASNKSKVVWRDGFHLISKSVVLLPKMEARSGLSSELHLFNCHLILEMQTSAKTGIGSPHMISSSKDFRQPSSILVVRSGPYHGSQELSLEPSLIDGSAVSGCMTKTKCIDQQFEAQLLQYIIHTLFDARRFQGFRRSRRKGAR